MRIVKRGSGWEAGTPGRTRRAGDDETPRSARRDVHRDFEAEADFSRGGGLPLHVKDSFWLASMPIDIDGGDVRPATHGVAAAAIDTAISP
jgi:hypothetical protein